jgi:hypothetical protein
MADPLVPNYLNGIGRLATDRYTYEKHINGTGDRHNANQIDLFPTVVIGTSQSNVQDAITAISTVIGTPPPDASTTVKGIVKLAGDIAGTATSVVVTRLQGKPVSALTPSSGDVLTWDGSTWKPQSISGSFTNLTVTGNTTLGTNSSNTLVVNAQTTLSNNLTVNGNTNLGNSGSDVITITGVFNVTGNTTLTGTLNVSSAITMSSGATAASYSSLLTTTLTSGDSVRVVSPNTLLLQSNTMTVTASNTLLSGFVKQNTGTFNIGSGSTFSMSGGSNASINAPFLLSSFGKINKKYLNGSNANISIYPALYDTYIAPTLTAARQWTIDETTYAATTQGFHLKIVNYSAYGITIYSPTLVTIVYVGPSQMAGLYRTSTSWELEYKVNLV